MAAQPTPAISSSVTSKSRSASTTGTATARPLPTERTRYFPRTGGLVADLARRTGWSGASVHAIDHIALMIIAGSQKNIGMTVLLHRTNVPLTSKVPDCRSRQGDQNSQGGRQIPHTSSCAYNRPRAILYTYEHRHRFSAPRALHQSVHADSEHQTPMSHRQSGGADRRPRGSLNRKDSFWYNDIFESWR
jgi:hypothetical protein